MKLFKAALIVLLAGGSIVGCPPVLQDTWETASTLLYAHQGYHGYFSPEGEGEYSLTVFDYDYELTRFTDRPDRLAGTELLGRFLRRSHGPLGLVGEPVGSIAYRLDDGTWEMVPAQFLGVNLVDLGTIAWRVRLLGEPPRTMLTGVTVYLDDKGKHETDEHETGVYLYAAGMASFETTNVAGKYRLVLANALPNLMLLGTSPQFQAALEPAELFTEITWPAYFADELPNAALTVETEEGLLETLVVVLSEPSWNAAEDTFTFTAEVLLGEPQGVYGPATLFIDDWNDREDTTIYKVVMNEEEQYSIWPADRENPPGWASAGFQGTKEECLHYIEVIWTDMRPLSLRRLMDQMG